MTDSDIRRVRDILTGVQDQLAETIAVVRTAVIELDEVLDGLPDGELVRS